MGQSKESIRLRQRKTTSGNTTLYLDIYLNGKRSYEYLKLYLIPETNRKDKEKNRQTLQFAEAIRANSVVEFQNGEYGFNAAYKLDQTFLTITGCCARSVTEILRVKGIGVIGTVVLNTLKGSVNRT